MPRAPRGGLPLITSNESSEATLLSRAQAPLYWPALTIGLWLKAARITASMLSA